MNKINLRYFVKFRAFGITFGSISGEKFLFSLPIGIPLPLPLGPVVDERGVTIWITED